MPQQELAWTCSACSLAWIERSTAVNSQASGPTAVAEIGYPENINPTYGLMDGSGSQLQRVLATYGLESSQAWLTFDSVYAIAQQTTGLLSGQAWYHWVSIRGVDGEDIWIANSAQGYRGIWDHLNREEFNQLGPFSVVYLT